MRQTCASPVSDSASGRPGSESGAVAAADVSPGGVGLSAGDSVAALESGWGAEASAAGGGEDGAAGWVDCSGAEGAVVASAAAAWSV